ncbi:C40 family peptidase [Catenulispora pinisilvae]|uniref:C40 family peptidase n=1 Tax=Catenulispora pinisilvae TaxID=2705253 RepID=UPI001890F7B2|nr:NlpC/P60 family protein [Catenulispora pinisilvae]
MRLTTRIAVAAGGAMLLLVVLLSAAASAVVSALTSPLDELFGSGGGGFSDAAGEIPSGMFALYHQAAAGCPGLPWSVLAGIGKVESDHGRAAVQVSSAGALGPMQMLPATFGAYALPVPPGGAVPASPWDPPDAAFAAARMLCRDGAAQGRDVAGAVFSYNHDHGYVARVLELADVYAATPPPAADALVVAAARQAPSHTARMALDYAAAQIGQPYVWGGDGPDRTGEAGFDCSGLTQSAYQAAGIEIPRTATAQFSTGRKVDRENLLPGDLVFYGTAGVFMHHVAMYVSDGYAIDAPRPGGYVRLDPVDAPDYAGAVREG